MQHVDARIGGGEPVGELTGAVGRAVIDHEHLGLGHRGVQPGDHPAQGLHLVVGRHHDHDAVLHGSSLLESVDDGAMDQVGVDHAVAARLERLHVVGDDGVRGIR